jgi:hypothetical protein
LYIITHAVEGVVPFKNGSIVGREAKKRKRDPEVNKNKESQSSPLPPPHSTLHTSSQKKIIQEQDCPSFSFPGTINKS